MTEVFATRSSILVPLCPLSPCSSLNRPASNLNVRPYPGSHARFGVQAEVRTKIRKAYCPEGEVAGNPVINWVRHIVFGKYDTWTVPQDGKETKYVHSCPVFCVSWFICVWCPLQASSHGANDYWLLLQARLLAPCLCSLCEFAPRLLVSYFFSCSASLSCRTYSYPDELEADFASRALDLKAALTSTINACVTLLLSWQRQFLFLFCSPSKPPTFPRMEGQKSIKKAKRPAAFPRTVLLFHVVLQQYFCSTDWFALLAGRLPFVSPKVS